MHAFTDDELKLLVSFANDDRVAVDTALLQRFSRMASDIQTNTIRHLSGARKRNATLTGQLEAKKEERRSMNISVGFAESGLDSVDVATALLYHLQQLHTYHLSKSKVIHILYEMYCSWLASKSERLFTEHPVATEFGPQLWRVSKRIVPTAAVPYEEWRRVAALNPGVAKFCENAARKYYDYADGELNKVFMKSEPYLAASKENNGGKWNKEIEDSKIYKWKTSKNALSVSRGM